MTNKKNNYNQLILISSLIISFIIITRYLTLSNTILIWVTDLSWTIASGLVTWKCWKLSTLAHNTEQKVWQYFTYAHLSWFIGILIWDYLELIAKVTTPFPALSDLGFMSFTILFIIALIKIRANRETKFLTALQVCKIGIFILSIIIIHIIVLSNLIFTSKESTLYISAAILYPVLYMSAFLYALTSFWQVLISQRGQTLILIVSSAAVHAFVVSIYSYTLLGKTYQAGNYIDVFWLIAFGLMYLATSSQNFSLNVITIRKSIYEKIQKYFDVLLAPIAAFAILITVFIFNKNIHSENIPIIAFMSLLFLILFTIKEIITNKYEEKLKLEIRKADEEFHIISNTVPGVIYQFCIDKDGKRYFPYVSPRIYDMIGVNDTAIMQDAELWINQIHPDDIADFEKTVLESYKTMTPWSWAGRMSHVDGTVGWYNGESVPILDNKTVKWSGIVFNITDKINSESKLKSANENLEARVKERTKELEIAVADAQTANNAKSEFLSHMSHELRTPLNAILGFGQLLSLNDLTKQQLVSVDEIVNAGNHLLSLINDILNLEAIESGSMNLNIENINVHDVVNQSLILIAQNAKDKQITIRNTIKAKDKVIVLADEFRLKEIMINLLSNAIKYSDQNDSVTITGVVLDNIVKICVTDTGKGINEDDFQGVFEPFNRLGAEKGNIEGTGIGLTICKKIIEAMNGTINFKSKINQGTTFCISLPKASVEKDLD